MDLQVKIVTPSQIAFEGSAVQVQIPGWDGEYGVLSEHANMLTLSKPGVVKLHGAADVKKILVGKGFAEVTSTEVSILVDSCEEVETIDKAKAKEELEHLSNELAQLSVNDSRYAFVKNRVEFAQAKVNA